MNGAEKPSESTPPPSAAPRAPASSQAAGRLAGAAFWALVAFSAMQAAWLINGGRVHGNDFKHLWLGSWLLGHGLNPYDPDMALRAARSAGLGSTNPFVYLPATGLLMRPLSLMSFAAASKVWFWLNWVLAWACVVFGPFAVAPGAPPRRAWLARWVGACFIVGAMPFMRQMTAGQMNVVLLAMILASVGALARGREGLAGAIMGAAAAYKISPLFMLASFALAGRHRAALAGGAVFAGLCVAAEIWAGAGAHAAALPTLASMGYGQSTWASQGMDFYRDPFNQSINSLFHHLLTENPHSVPWASLGPAAANGATRAICLVLLGFWLFAGVVTGRALAARKAAAANATRALGASSHASDKLTHALDTTTRATNKSTHAFTDLTHASEKQTRAFDASTHACKTPARALAFFPRAFSRHSPPQADPGEIGFFMLSMLTALLLPSLMWDHYAVQALAAAFWLAAMGPPVGAGSGGFSTARSAAFWLAFAAAFWALSWPWPHPNYDRGPAALLMSLRLWGTLGLLALTWIRWRSLSPEAEASSAPAADADADVGKEGTPAVR